MSDRLVCKLASGFFEECQAVDPELAESLPSSSLLSSLHRKSQTRHETKAGEIFAREGLALPVRVDTIEEGKAQDHPVLRISEYIKVLALHDQLPVLWGGGSAMDVLPKFWRRFKRHQGSHEVFTKHGEHLERVLPLQLHADEGQTLKKTGIMIINWQSPIGTGTSRQTALADPMGLNFLGSSYATRFLVTVCLKRKYAKKKCPEYLDEIFAYIAGELYELFHSGLEVVVGDQRVRYYVACTGFKGDWPIHARAGRLQRHFAKKGVLKATRRSGICHLCRAGELGFPAHDYDPNAAWRSTVLSRPPWTHPGPLTRIPQTPHKEELHKFDVFHTLLKGCFSELAGSGLASCPCSRFCSGSVA